MTCNYTLIPVGRYWSPYRLALHWPVCIIIVNVAQCRSIESLLIDLSFSCWTSQSSNQ